MDTDQAQPSQNVAALILRIKPVPRPLHQINLRSALDISQWDAIRRPIMEERGLRCETFGHECEDPSAINAHEEWIYDTTSDPAVATISGIVLQCPMCYGCEIFFRMESQFNKGKIEKLKIDGLVEHFCKVNKVTRADFAEHRKAVWEEWTRILKLRWKIDLSPYSEKYSGQIFQLEAVGKNMGADDTISS